MKKYFIFVFLLFIPMVLSAQQKFKRIPKYWYQANPMYVDWFSVKYNSSGDIMMQLIEMRLAHYNVGIFGLGQKGFYYWGPLGISKTILGFSRGTFTFGARYYYVRKTYDYYDKFEWYELNANSQFDPNDTEDHVLEFSLRLEMPFLQIKGGYRLGGSEIGYDREFVRSEDAWLHSNDYYAVKTINPFSGPFVEVSLGLSHFVGHHKFKNLQRTRYKEIPLPNPRLELKLSQERVKVLSGHKKYVAATIKNTGKGTAENVGLHCLENINSQWDRSRTPTKKFGDMKSGTSQSVNISIIGNDDIIALNEKKEKSILVHFREKDGFYAEKYIQVTVLPDTTLTLSELQKNLNESLLQHKSDNAKKWQKRITDHFAVSTYNESAKRGFRELIFRSKQLYNSGKLKLLQDGYEKDRAVVNNLGKDVESYFVRALEQNPADPLAQAGMAIFESIDYSYSDQNRFDFAKSYFDFVIEMEPRPEFYIFRGSLFGDHSDLSKSKSAFGGFIELTKDTFPKKRLCTQDFQTAIKLGGQSYGQIIRRLEQKASYQIEGTVLPGSLSQGSKHVRLNHACMLNALLELDKLPTAPWK